MGRGARNFSAVVARGPRADELHVMAVRLPAGDAPLRSLWGVLTRAEQRRAQAMVSPAARRQFVAGRALIRRLLALRTGGAPRAVRLAYGRRGKPVCRDAGLAFNLSHAGAWLLLAVARSGQVGVDVESTLGTDEARRLAPRVLGAEEKRRLATLPPGRVAGFVQRHLVLKEAVMKADGGGLALGLRRLQVSSGGGAAGRPGRGLLRDWPLEDGARVAAAWAARRAGRLVQYPPQNLAALQAALRRLQPGVCDR